MNCKDCALWQKTSTIYDIPKGRGMCKSTHISDHVDLVPVNGLSYSYQEGGHFVSGPEFGCIHFTPKKK